MTRFPVYIYVTEMNLKEKELIFPLCNISSLVYSSDACMSTPRHAWTNHGKDKRIAQSYVMMSE